VLVGEEHHLKFDAGFEFQDQPTRAKVMVLYHCPYLEKASPDLAYVITVSGG